MAKITNPIIPSDYPDVDVIRVEDTYYMVSTTMTVSIWYRETARSG